MFCFVLFYSVFVVLFFVFCFVYFVLFLFVCFVLFCFGFVCLLEITSSYTSLPTILCRISSTHGQCTDVTTTGTYPRSQSLQRPGSTAWHVTCKFYVFSHVHHMQITCTSYGFHMVSVPMSRQQEIIYGVGQQLGTSYLSFMCFHMYITCASHARHIGFAWSMYRCVLDISIMGSKFVKTRVNS